MSRELAGKTIVNLEQNLHLRKMFMKSKPGTIDNDSDCTLRNPCDCSWKEKFINSVEDVPTIAEAILDETILEDLARDALVPSENARVCLEPTLLS